MRQKESAQFRSEKGGAVRSRIKIEKQAAVIGQKSRSDIVDEKFPIRGRPFDSVAHFSDSVKTNPVRGHEIERLMKIGQGSLAFDSADDARDVEQFNRGAEKRFVVGIEAEHMVAEMFANEKEVTRASAKIENAERRRAVEPQVLRPLDIDVDPISNVLESVDLG